MLRFLKNKLIMTFMIVGALTQQAQAWVKYPEGVKVIMKTNWIPGENGDEPLSLAEMFREIATLERTISFEFAERYRKIAEEAMRTGDDTALKEFRQERDRILAKRQKDWDEGTFDKVAEAKRWAEYLRRRALDQELVNYPIHIGKPPFPIDMSILDSAEEKTTVAKNATPVVDVPVTKTPKTSLDEIKETLRLLEEDTPSKSNALPHQKDLEELLTDLAVYEKQTQPAQEITDIPVHPVVITQTAEEKPTSDELPLEIKQDNSDKPTRKYHQRDLDELLAALDAEEKQTQPAPKTTDVPVQPVVVAQATEEKPVSSELPVEIKQDNSDKPTRKYHQRDLDELLAALDAEEKQTQPTPKDADVPVQPVVVAQATEEKTVSSELPLEIKQDNSDKPTKKYHQRDLDELLAALDAEEKQAQPAPKAADVPVQPVVVTQTVEEKPISDELPVETKQENIAPKKRTLHQRDLDELLADLGEEEKQPQQKPTMIDAPVQTVAKVEKVNEADTTERKSSASEIEELLALLGDKQTPVKNPEEPKLPPPYKTISLVGLGILAAGALKRPKKGKLDREPSLSAIKSALKQEIPTKPVQANIEKTAPKEPLPRQAEITTPISPISNKDDSNKDKREFLAKRLHAIRLMEDIKRARYKLTRQMQKAKANNDIEQIKMIEANRHAFTTLRKEAFATAAGPVLGEIKEERRLLTKKMTLARRRKDTELMSEITQRRTLLKLQEQKLKAVVREFKYKHERSKFLNPKIAERIKLNLRDKKVRQRS